MMQIHTINEMQTMQNNMSAPYISNKQNLLLLLVK